MGKLKMYAPILAPEFDVSKLGIGYENKQAVVALTSTNLLNMNGTPVAVLAAPGTGKLLWVRRILFIMARTATAYANGGAVSFQYHTATTIVPHEGSIPATVLTTSSAATTYSALGPNTDANAPLLPTNDGIDITNATAPFITGTGTARVFIEYTVVTP